MKATKKLLALLLAVVLVCTTLPLALAEDGDATIYGTDGDLVWTLDNKGVLTINGEGRMTGNNPWSTYSGAITKVVIKDGVTSIGDSAFSGCTSLTSVTIPDSVTYIGYDAFFSCTSLTSVTIPDSVMSVEKSAFRECFALKSVTLGDGLQSIGSSAFYECTSLMNVTIPDSVTNIGDYAFFGCSSLTSVTIPDSVTSIGSHAFYYCWYLTSVIIPDSVTSIGSRAFADCWSLTSVTIGSGVISIGEWAFDCRSSLSRVDITDLAVWCKISFGNAYANPFGNNGGNIYLNGELLETVDVPEGVSTINAYAFYNCQSIKTVTLPITVGSIGPSAFSGCSNLESVTILNGLCTIADSATAISPSAAICSYDNTEAQAYAEKYNRTFVSLGEYTHEHTPVIREEPGTCKTKGFRLTTCSVCGEQLDYQQTTYGDHQYEIVDRWGDCEKGGTVEYRCSVCGEYKEEQLPSTGHTLGDWQTQAAEGCNGSYEYRECTVCGWRETRNEQPGTHRWVEFDRDNNCEKGGVGYYCDICGEKKWEQLPSKPHTFGEWQRQEPDGCTDGLEYRVCTVCGYKESKVLRGNHELVEYDRYVTNTSCKVYYRCNLCGKNYAEYLCESGHTYGLWSRFVMADDVANEVEIRFCNTCGYYELRQAGTHDPGEDPTAPTDPTNPTDPTEPTNPTDPTDPTNPTDPTEPTTEPTTQPSGENEQNEEPQGFFQRIAAFFRNLFDRIFGIFRR